MARSGCFDCGAVEPQSDSWTLPEVSLRLEKRIWTQRHPLYPNLCNDCQAKQGFSPSWWAFPHEPGTNLEESFKIFMSKLKERFPEWGGKV